MPYAITPRVDADAAAAVRRLWSVLADGGFDDDCQALGYAPHVTLAVHPDDVPASSLCKALQAEAAGWAALPVALAGLDILPHPHPVISVAPAVTPALLDRQAAVQALLADVSPQLLYRSGAWVPHVTLAGGSGALRDPAGAVAALLPLWQPLEAWLDQVDLVRFRPAEVLWSRRLALTA